MNYIIENDKIKVEISSYGAEIQSILGKKSGFEYLWQAGVEGQWKNKATILFPICGRLFEGKYCYQGKEYQMPLHGFAKISEFSVFSKTKEQIVLELNENQETLKMYPFKFNLKVIYTVDGSTVRTEFKVRNTGNEDLPFSVGGHPGFALPFEKGSDFTDHYVEFENAKKRNVLHFSERGLFLGDKTPYQLENDKKLTLNHELFVDDAIFLTEDKGSVVLKSDKSDKFVKVSYTNMKYVGFWQTYTDNTNFICIEPWAGIPADDCKIDDFATKRDFVHLNDGESYTNYFDITVSE